MRGRFWIGSRLQCYDCGLEVWQGRLIHHWAYGHGWFNLQANARRQDFAEWLTK